MAYFWNICANALIRVHLWSHGFATSQYGLTSLFLKQDSMLTRWQVKKLRRKNKGQVTCAP